MAAIDTLPRLRPDIELTGKRLLLITPHPDDESLALGGLIQQALRKGADITLLQVTDGDNNPWPQRWLERRWRIGPDDRKRWGRRRAGEVRQAIECLGLPGASLRRLGWPDLGVCARLRDDGVDAIDAFASVMRDVQPDIVVLPDLADRHPDHGGVHVLTRLAMARLSLVSICLTYLVHGAGAVGGELWDLLLDAQMREAKRQAVLAHRTQTTLARRRLLAMVGPSERLYRLPESMNGPLQPLPWRPALALRPWLQLTIAHPHGVDSWPWNKAPLEREGSDWKLAQTSTTWSAPIFARLELRCTSPWIFDHWGWSDLTATAAAGQADH